MLCEADNNDYPEMGSHSYFSSFFVVVLLLYFFYFSVRQSAVVQPATT